MITTGCLMLIALVNYVSPLPVSKGENADIRVMKCIVEVIADALSRPHPLPVSQQCLDILRTDERLISILRHQNFLQELQDIAVEGAKERAQMTESQTGMMPQDAPDGPEANPDQSMLLAGMSPGQKRWVPEEDDDDDDEEEEEEDEKREVTESQESQGANEIEGQEQHKSQEGPNPSNHISDFMNQENQSEEKEGEMAENEEEEEEEEEKKKQTDSKKEEEEEAVAHSKEVSGSPGKVSEVKPSSEEEEEEEERGEEKKRMPSDRAEVDRKKNKMEGEQSKEEEDEEAKEEEEKRGVEAKQWKGIVHHPQGLQAQRRHPVGQEEALEQAEELEEERRRSSEDKRPQEMPHHSKEVNLEEGEEDGEVTPGVKRSPEERELRMMARREPDDRRDEEGSATRKAEDPEIESLAAIESELENVAQKLHELRRG